MEGGEAGEGGWPGGRHWGHLCSGRPLWVSKMPVSAFQSPIFRECRGGSPLADSLGTWSGPVLKSRQTQSKMGGPKERPRLPGWGLGRVKAGVLSVQSPSLPRSG